MAKENLANGGLKFLKTTALQTETKNTIKASIKATLSDLPVTGRSGIKTNQPGKSFSKTENAICVSGFIPYRSEIDVTGLMVTLTANGYQTCLPIVVGDELPLIFRNWQPGDETQAGAWGIPIPLPSSPIIEPDVLLVPLLAFDKSGYRLGYGGGFYDRTIEKLRQSKPIITIGIAYSAQEVTNVPTDTHDQQLDWILTEKGPMKCG